MNQAFGTASGRPQWLVGFLCSSSVVLLGTGVAKIASAFSGNTVLRTYDPVLGVPQGLLFGVTGMLEVTVALVCLCRRCAVFATVLVFWLSTSFLVYRLGSFWLAAPRYCGCLGTMTGYLGVDSAAADMALKLVLGYLFTGSAIALGILLKRQGLRGLIEG